jgi:hypothetical protein
VVALPCEVSSKLECFSGCVHGPFIAKGTEGEEEYP